MSTRPAPQPIERENATGVRCLACGTPGPQAVRGYRTQSPHGRALFGRGRILQCRECGLAQLDPVPSPEALARYYEHDYRSSGLYGGDVMDPARFPKDNLFYYNRGCSIAELVGRELKAEPREILDVGAGFGHILHAFGERYPGARRLAIEFSDVCVDHLRAIGIEAVSEPMEAVLPRLDRRFDVIILSHVLEHLLEPRPALELLASRLAPGGNLYIEVPHIPRDALRQHLDNVWAPRYDEPHITFFSPETLRRTLEDVGLRVDFCETAGPEYRRISGLRYRLPPFRRTVQRMMPRRLFHMLRGSRATSALRVQDREEVFYRYGGRRIWIRSLSRVR